MLTIESRRSSKKNIDTIIVSLNEKILKFTGKASIKLERSIKDKTDGSDEANLFECQNEYMANVFTREQKQALFDCYRRAHDVVESGKFTDYQAEINSLLPLIDEIFTIIDADKFANFINYSRHLQIPKDLGLAASKGDYPEETTIDDNAYVNLVKLTFMGRVLYPIIFGLLYRFEAIMGNDYAELACGALIKNNATLRAMPGWTKLVTYLTFTFNKRGIPAQSLEVGSNEHFIERLLYKTLFTRLFCAVIPETEEGKNIATTINAVVKQAESNSNVYRKKDASYDDDEDKRSFYEKYQISEQVNSAKEAAQAEYFTFGMFDELGNQKPGRWFEHQCAGLKIQREDLVERVFNNLPDTWDFVLDQHIIKVLQLTYFGEVSPNIFYVCNYAQLMASIALAQVRLSEWGYRYLPSVLGAVHDDNGMRTLPDVLKLNTEDREMLDTICDVQAKNSEGRSNNEAILAATDFLDNFGNGVWKTNLEIGVLDEPQIYQRVKKGELFPLEITSEIKNEFIDLIMRVNT